MKLGLHAHSLLLAAGLRDYQPVGRGALTATQMLEKTAHLRCAALQLARRNLTEWDMVALVNLRREAEERELTLHLSTNLLDGNHLADMIRAAYTLGAQQVSVGLAHLKGNVQQRQRFLESLLADLDVAIKTAERYKVMLALENGHQTAAVDLAALIQAAQSEWVGVCFDMGNALTVPENPLKSAETLAPYCKSAHLKDFQVYRSLDGVVLLNCPIGEGVLDVVGILRILKLRQPLMTVFLQTAAERLPVPMLNDDFLQEYPRITARALADLLRQGSLGYQEDTLLFPHERGSSERETLKWEEDRVKRSLKQAQKLMGTESLTLSLG